MWEEVEALEDHTDVSALLRPRVAPAAALWLSLIAGIAVHDAVLQVTGLVADIRWPNDLLLGPQKFGNAGSEHQVHAVGAMYLRCGLGNYRRHHSLGSSWIFYAAILLNEKLRSLAGNTAAAAAERALLHPSLRPSEMKCSDSLLPR